MVKFVGHQPPKTPKNQYGTLDGTFENNILNLLREQSNLKQTEIAEHMQVSLRTVKRIIKKLADNGTITRFGGKRFGYWEVKRD